MFNEATEAMKYDNRLRARRDWVSPDDLAQELAALPDSSDKVMAPGEEAAAKPSASSVSPQSPVVPEAAPLAPIPEPEPAPATDSPFAALASHGSAAGGSEPAPSFGTDSGEPGSDAGGTHDA